MDGKQRQRFGAVLPQSFKGISGFSEIHLAGAHLFPYFQKYEN